MLAEKWQVKNWKPDFSLPFEQLENRISGLDYSRVAKPRPKLSVEELKG
jgi:hypothetical protein